MKVFCLQFTAFSTVTIRNTLKLLETEKCIWKKKNLVKENEGLKKCIRGFIRSRFLFSGSFIHPDGHHETAAPNNSRFYRPSPEDITGLTKGHSVRIIKKLIKEFKSVVPDDTKHHLLSPLNT